MTEQLCTYFDINYLPRMLALYRSLERHCDQFVLWALCFDDDARDLLSRLGLPQVRALPLEVIERRNPRLALTRSARDRVQYMWAFTPAIVRYLLDGEPGADLVTYLDADLYFFADPAIATREIGDGSVLIVGHRFSPEYERLENVSGRYNVGLLSFRNDSAARECLDWWAARCVESTECDSSKRRFGDQKYLDDWPERFAGVRVLEHKGCGVAPWNLSTHPVTRGTDGAPVVRDAPLVYFHFHALKLVRPGLGWVVSYRLPRRSARLVYGPYLREIRRSYRDLARICPGFRKGLTPLDGRAAIWTLARLRWPFYLGAAC